MPRRREGGGNAKASKKNQKSKSAAKPLLDVVDPSPKECKSSSRAKPFKASKVKRTRARAKNGFEDRLARYEITKDEYETCLTDPEKSAYIREALEHKFKLPRSYPNDCSFCVHAAVFDTGGYISDEELYLAYKATK